jgi:hypothetical protein
MDWRKAARGQAEPGKVTIDPFKPGKEGLGVK